MKMLYRKILLVLIVSGGSFFQCTASLRPDTANPYFEINRIMGTMANANHISFNATYYYEDLDTAGIKRDTLSVVYKINGQKYYAQVDSTILVQNDFYNIAVAKKDSMITISRPKSIFPALFKTDILDATLEKVYLSKIVLSDSLINRKLSFVFNSYSPFASLDLVYDTVSYNISYIKYKLKHYVITDAAAQATQSTYYTMVKLVFTNYQLNMFTDTVFDISPYINRVNGVFVAVPPYASFDIFNQVMNQ